MEAGKPPPVLSWRKRSDCPNLDPNVSTLENGSTDWKPSKPVLPLLTLRLLQSAVHRNDPVKTMALRNRPANLFFAMASPGPAGLLSRVGLYAALFYFDIRLSIHQLRMPDSASLSSRILPAWPPIRAVMPLFKSTGGTSCFASFFPRALL